MSADDLLAVVSDSSVLVNFLLLDRVDLLAKHPRYRFHLPEEVRREITAPEERKRLERSLEDGAAAAHRRWIVALDEKGRARREARERVGETRIVNTPGILIASTAPDG